MDIHALSLLNITIILLEAFNKMSLIIRSLSTLLLKYVKLEIRVGAGKNSITTKGMEPDMETLMRRGENKVSVVEEQL